MRKRNGGNEANEFYQKRTGNALPVCRTNKGRNPCRLKEIVPVLERKDGLLSKVIVENTIRKLEKLAEPECSQFIADNRAAKNPPDLAHARIYDRILERCAPVLFSGKNFREEGARATKAAAKEIVRKDNKV